MRLSLIMAFCLCTVVYFNYSQGERERQEREEDIKDFQRSYDGI